MRSFMHATATSFPRICPRLTPSRRIFTPKSQTSLTFLLQMYAIITTCFLLSQGLFFHIHPEPAVVFRHLSFSPHPAMNPKRARQCATGSSVVTIRAVSVSAQHASVFNDQLASAASPLHSDICKDLADSLPPSHLFVQNRMEEMAEHQHH